jgi:CubicO group peptidase (beta-lactamase class C family)
MDYFKFANALMMGGIQDNTRILKEETVASMTSNHLDTLHLSDGEQFGYGFSVYTADGSFGRKMGRYSWGGFWQTIFWVDPSRNIVALLMTNARETPKWNELFDGYERIVNQSVKE